MADVETFFHMGQIQIRLRFNGLDRTKFCVKNYLVLVNPRTKLQLDNSKFAWVRQYWENIHKILTFQSILTKFNTKGSWLIYYISVQL